jgi:hypothetical protein
MMAAMYSDFESVFGRSDVDSACIGLWLEERSSQFRSETYTNISNTPRHPLCIGHDHLDIPSAVYLPVHALDRI